MTTTARIRSVGRGTKTVVNIAFKKLMLIVLVVAVTAALITSGLVTLALKILN